MSTAMPLHDQPVGTTRARSPLWLLATREIEGLLLHQRGMSWLLGFSVLLSTLAVLLVSDRELSLLDNAQVVYMTMATVTAAGAAIAIVLGSDTFAGERERGTLVPLLIAPVDSRTLVLGKACGLLCAWELMYLLATPYLWAVGANGQHLDAALASLAVLGTPVVFGFGLLAMALSARAGSVTSALVSSMLVLLLAASPVVIGPGLRASAVGRILDAANPFAAALNGFDAMVVDGDPLAAQTVRLALVTGWLAVTFLAARVTARHPRFR